MKKYFWLLIPLLIAGLFFFFLHKKRDTSIPTSKIVVAKKDHSQAKFAFIDDKNKVNESLTNAHNLGKAPVYAPLNFAVNIGNFDKDLYNYEAGYFYAIVSDTITQQSRTFQSFALNPDYQSPAISPTLLPNYPLRIRFYLENEHHYKIQLYSSTNPSQPLQTYQVQGTASVHHGPLHFSALNPHYLLAEDSTAFFGIAHNFSYEGEPSSKMIRPFYIEKTLRRYLPQGINHLVGQPGSYMVSNVLGKFKAQGGNLIQLYLEAHTFQIDNSVLGDYRQEEDRMRALEEVFQFCYENDIYIQLAITDHNDVVEWYNTNYCRTNTCDSLKGGSDPNPYKEYVDKNPLIVRGSLDGEDVGNYIFPNTRMLYYVHPHIQQFLRNKFQYIVARFGHYPNLFAFSLFSEQETLGDDDARNFDDDIDNLKLAIDKDPYPIESVDKNAFGLYHFHDNNDPEYSHFWIPPAQYGGEIKYAYARDIAAQWVLDMADFVHGLDKNLLVAAGGTVWLNDTLLYKKNCPLNFVSSHVYDRPPTRNSLFINNILLRAATYGKPFLRGEGGTQNGQANEDISRTNFHNSLWATAFSGSFSTYMEWFWQQNTFNEVEWAHPERNKPYQTLKPVAAFFGQEVMHAHKWIPMASYYKKDVLDWKGWEHNFGQSTYLDYFKDPTGSDYFQIDAEFKKPMNWTNKEANPQYYDAAPPIFGRPCVEYVPEFFAYSTFNFDATGVRQRGAYPRKDQIKMRVNNDLNDPNSMEVEVFALKSPEKILGWVHHKESYWLNHIGLDQDPGGASSIICASPPHTNKDMRNQIFNLSNISMEIPMEGISGVYELTWFSTFAVNPDGSPKQVGNTTILQVQNGVLIVPVPNLRVDNDPNNTNLPEGDYAFKMNRKQAI